MTSDQYSPDYMAQGDCHDCGIPYGSPRFPDLVVPHDQWAKISPSGDENGLLCPNCMCARAESAGVECRAIFRSGPFFDAHPVHQPAHDAVARLVEALEAMLHAVCGETGFAACVRLDSGLAYPWPALDAAEEKAQSALRALKSDDTPAASSPGRAVSSEPVWLDVTARPQEAPTPPVDVNETPVHERQAGLMLTDDTQADPANIPSPEEILDLIGEFGREVFYLLDDCETSGPVGEEVHTITGESLKKVSDLLDRIDALPFEEPDCILGTGAMLQEAVKRTFSNQNQQPDPVREAARAAGFAQGIEAALAVVTEEARRQLWHARHVGNDTKTRERASSAWSALNIAAQTIRALAPQPEPDPVREAAMRDKIARIIIEDQLQLLSDFDVDGELYRHDPECGAAAYVTADAILRALASQNKEASDGR